jgi:predicted nucleic acid-binding Zn ribbon protein
LLQVGWAALNLLAKMLLLELGSIFYLLIQGKSYLWLTSMSLTGLPNILQGIQSRTSWQQRCQYLLIVEKWADIVGESVAKQTCPIGVYQKALQVAVSSSVWSQALTFERVRILAKVNALFSDSGTLAIADIHFSTAKWATQQQTLKERMVVAEDHPSYLPPAIANASSTRKPKPNLKISKLETPKPPDNASEAFQRWQEVMKLRTNQMPQCPRCDRPALTGEMSRWQMCRVCAIEYLFK